MSAPNGVAESLSANTAGTVISAAYNPTNRTLSLSGVDTVANYQKVLRTITYNNSAASPTLGQRYVQTTVFDGGLTSSARTTTIQVQAVNYAPVVTTSATSLTYVRNTAAIVVDSALTITDADAQPLPYAQLQQAQVIISGGFVPGQDQLVYTNTAGIPGTFNPTTGILTLTGYTSIANYITALRSVKFQTASTTLGPRTITFRVQDSTNAVNGALWSNSATRTVDVLGPLLAANATSSSGQTRTPVLSDAALRPIVAEAVARWSHTGLSASQLAILSSATVEIRDLDRYQALGLAGGNRILIDDNAVGFGWFVDTTPHDDREFFVVIDTNERRSPA